MLLIFLLILWEFVHSDQRESSKAEERSNYSLKIHHLVFTFWPRERESESKCEKFRKNVSLKPLWINDGRWRCGTRIQIATAEEVPSPRSRPSHSLVRNPEILREEWCSTLVAPSRVVCNKSGKIKITGWDGNTCTFVDKVEDEDMMNCNHNMAAWNWAATTIVKIMRYRSNQFPPELKSTRMREYKLTSGSRRAELQYMTAGESSKAEEPSNYSQKYITWFSHLGREREWE